MVGTTVFQRLVYHAALRDLNALLDLQIWIVDA